MVFYFLFIFRKTYWPEMNILGRILINQTKGNERNDEGETWKLVWVRRPVKLQKSFILKLTFISLQFLEYSIIFHLGTLGIIKGFSLFHSYFLGEVKISSLHTKTRKYRIKIEKIGFFSASLYSHYISLTFPLFLHTFLSFLKWTVSIWYFVLKCAFLFGYLF